MTRLLDKTKSLKYIKTIDTLGNKKYSFKLTPKKPKANSIFNLVIDASNDPINVALLEYRMSPSFGLDYHEGTKTFSEFTGSIIKFPFSADFASDGFSKTGKTCIQNIDEVVDCSIINIDGVLLWLVAVVMVRPH